MSAAGKGTFPDRVAEAARLAGGVVTLATRTGLTRQVIGKYMRGESDPSRERLVALADAAGVSVEWLAAGRGPMRVGGTPSAQPTHGDPKERFKAWLDGWWSRADEKERIWFEVEMCRLFPAFAEWQKKQPADSANPCDA